MRVDRDSVAHIKTMMGSRSKTNTQAIAVVMVLMVRRCGVSEARACRWLQITSECDRWRSGSHLVASNLIDPGPQSRHLVPLVHVVANRSREIHDRVHVRVTYLFLSRAICAHMYPQCANPAAGTGGMPRRGRYIIGLTKLCQNLRPFKAPSSVLCRDKNPTNPTTLQILNHIDLRGDLNAPYNKQRQQKSTHNQHHIAS